MAFIDEQIYLWVRVSDPSLKESAPTGKVLQQKITGVIQTTWRRLDNTEPQGLPPSSPTFRLEVRDARYILAFVPPFGNNKISPRLRASSAAVPLWEPRRKGPVLWEESSDSPSAIEHGRRISTRLTRRAQPWYRAGLPHFGRSSGAWLRRFLCPQSYRRKNCTHWVTSATNLLDVVHEVVMLDTLSLFGLLVHAKTMRRKGVGICCSQHGNDKSGATCVTRDKSENQM